MMQEVVMLVRLEIPEEFTKGYNDDRFADFFKRVKADCEGILCGTYEKKTLDMLLVAFQRSECIDG